MPVLPHCGVRWNFPCEDKDGMCLGDRISTEHSVEQTSLILFPQKIFFVKARLKGQRFMDVPRQSYINRATTFVCLSNRISEMLAHNSAANSATKNFPHSEYTFEDK